jgi:hypothetical protein
MRVGRIVKSFMSACLSVLPSAWNDLAPNDRIFIKFDILLFSENILKKFKFHLNLTRIAVI